jgi:replicative DNA helicase
MLGYRVPVEFRKRNLKYDPYILGLWIGDGTRTKPSITSVDIETQNYIRNFCDEHNFRLSITDEHRAPSYNIVNGNIGGKVNPFLDFIRSQQVNGEKRISQDYLTSCREDRLRLLAGLVDSDGHKVREGGYEIITKYPELAKQIKFLAQSLGYKCSDNIKRVQYKGELRTYRRLYISGDLRDVPVLISRKKQTKKPARTELTYGFKVIERGEDDYYGFEIDGNHLYCLGDFTVTHNTSVALQIMENTSKAGNKTTYFSFDMSLDDTYEKILIRHTGKDGDEIMRNIKDNDEEKIQQYKNILSKYYKNVDFVFKPGLSIEDMEKAIIEREEETGVPTKLVVVDYLTLIKTPGSDGNQKVIDAIQGLRFLAHNMNVCVFVLLQPNKMNSTPSEPIKSYNAIKGSSEVPEACTAILTAYREGFNPLNFDEDHYFTFICVKNRKGRLFSLDYNWRGKEGMIREMEPIERETLKELRAMKKEEAEEQRQRWTSDRNGRSPI